MKDLFDSPEGRAILAQAKEIKEYGGIFKYNLNKHQPKNMMVQLTKTKYVYDEDDTDEIINEVVTYKSFMNLSDLYLYLHKTPDRHHTIHNLVKNTPSTWEYKGNKYETSFIDSKPTKLYKLDLYDLIPYKDNVSYWMSDDEDVYKKLDSQDRIEKRVWQYTAAGSKWLNFSGKSLSITTLSSRKTDDEIII